MLLHQLPLAQTAQMIGYTTLLVLCLGPSALAGIAVMLCLIPVSFIFGTVWCPFSLFWLQELLFLGHCGTVERVVSKDINLVRMFRFQTRSLPSIGKCVGIREKRENKNHGYTFTDWSTRRPPPRLRYVSFSSLTLPP